MGGGRESGMNLSLIMSPPRGYYPFNGRTAANTGGFSTQASIQTPAIETTQGA